MPLTKVRLFLWCMAGAYVALAVSLAPRTPPYFRPWERMQDGGDSRRFVRSATVTMASCGDLSHNLWRRERQVWRTTTFTTDAVGLRNPERPRLPRLVIVGDSFVAGANLDDRETLSAALERRLHEPVYNAGALSATRELQRLASDPRFERTPPRVVILTLASRNLLALPPTGHPTWTLPEAPLLGALEEKLGDVIEGMKRDSGLAEWSRYHVGRLRGLVSAHPYREVRWGETTALCLSPREQRRLHVGAAENAERLAATLQACRDHFAARGATLVFAPVPEPAAVYPELFTTADLGDGEPLLEACVDAARRAGVTTVDLLPHFRTNRTPYLYMPDDSHWSPQTVELAAEVLAAEVRPLLVR